MWTCWKLLKSHAAEVRCCLPRVPGTVQGGPGCHKGRSFYISIFAILRRFGSGCRLIRPSHIVHNWSQVVLSAGEWAGASPGISLGGQAAPQVEILTLLTIPQTEFIILIGFIAILL